MKIGLGHLGLSPDVFWDMTPREFFNTLNGYREQLIEKEKAEWNRVNYIAYSIMINNPYIKIQDKPRTFEDYMLGDKKTEQPKLTREQARKLILG